MCLKSLVLNLQSPTSLSRLPTPSPFRIHLTLALFFTPASLSPQNEVLRILHSAPPKSSSVDFVPPSLVKSCAAVFAELIAELANRCFSSGCFSACFKHAAIIPLLKKPTLETSDPSRYMPISDLDFISKILEPLFLARFQPHILACSNFNHHQSAYRPRHSTETSLLSTLDTIYRASDFGFSILHVSLDLSAAFDTIDHVTLINRLRTSFGITGSVLSWLQSYLSNRTQSVRIGHHSSTPTRCTTGVPQGSVLVCYIYFTDCNYYSLFPGLLSSSLH